MSSTEFNAEIDRIIQSLSGYFPDDSGDTLQDLSALLDRVGKGVSSATEALLVLRREAHSLKGLGGSFGFPSISLVAHRLEDYVVALEELDTHHLSDTRTFIEAMQDIVESRNNPTDDACSRILRQLPAKRATDKRLLVQIDLEVLLITPSHILRSAAEAQLHSRGYRVVTLRSPLAAFETVVRSRPDMIIASAVMDGVGGVDLARAFHAMSVTRNIPFVLLTSFDRTYPELDSLPSRIILLHHDLDLYSEIDNALGWFSPS